MQPQAPSATGLGLAAPAQANAVSPSGAPGVPGVPQGAIAPLAPTQAPTNFDTAGMMQAIGNYYQIPKQTALAQAGVEGNKFNATTAYEGQLQEESTFAKERLDPSAYKIVNAPNGGKVILDPVSGQQVDIGTYVNRTGANPADVLKDSTNPQDQQFVSDYNDFQGYMNAKLNEKASPEAAKTAQAYENAVKKQYNIDLASMNPQQVANLFLSEYGNYLGIPGSQTPSQAMWTPTINQNDINYLLSRYIYTGNLPQINIGGLDLSTLGSSGNNPSTPISNAQNYISNQLSQYGNTSNTASP